MAENPICTLFKDWLGRQTGQVVFTIPNVLIDLKLTDSDSQRIYRCIARWRLQFQEFYDDEDKIGNLTGDSSDKYATALERFEKEFDIQPFWYNRKGGVYYVPEFAQKEIMSGERMRRWIRSGQRVAYEMELFGEELVLTGKPPLEIIKDLRLIEDKILNGTVLKCPFCEANIQDDWKACPYCENTLPQELEDGN
jgi:hypothetical protein